MTTDEVRNIHRIIRNARVSRRRLIFKITDTSDAQTLHLPFGLTLDPKGTRVCVHDCKTVLTAICARVVGEKNTTCTILSPSYEAVETLTDSKTGTKCELRLWLVSADRDRLQAREVILREHYLADSNRGMVLAAAFVDPKAQLAIRGARKGHRTSASKLLSWILPAGGVVACAVVDTLWHGNPVQGRSLIAASNNLGAKWTSWNRSEIVARFRIAWGSRFAVDQPYQSLGIGTLLAKHLKTVARHYRIPSANYLEVITTRPKRPKDLRVEQAKNDFLERAGYVKLPKTMRSGSLMVMDERTGYRAPVSAIKNYYYADIRAS